MAENVPRARLLSARHAKLRIALLAAPLNDGVGTISGAIALVVRGGEEEARLYLQWLESLTTLTASTTLIVAAPRDQRQATTNGASAQVLARASGVTSPVELAFAITNSLRNKLSCEQVALGLVARRRVRILSVSGMDDVPKRSPGIAQMRAAMEECLDCGTPIIAQNDSGWADEKLSSQHCLHQRWRQTAGGAAVASVPLYSGENCVAILSLRRRDDQPLRREHVDEIRKLTEPFAPALLLVKRANRGLLCHLGDSCSAIGGALFGRGRLGLKLVSVLVMLAAGWFCFGTMNYEITVPAAIVPAEERHLATPYDAVLATVSATVGDRVHAGQVLCEFDQRDMRLERERLLAEAAVLERELTRAQADDEPVEARLVEVQQRLVRTQLAVVERQLEQAVVRAPFDGVIITGDLRKQVGAVFARGTPLYEIAPLDHWTLEVAAPEASAGELHLGQAGRFASHARPESTHEFSLIRVAPGAEVRDGRNVYVAEAELDAAADWLRPGMEGVARISVGSRKVWWITLHQFVDYLRLHYWL